jgi:hypothetical protein
LQKAALSLPLSDKLKAMLILAHDFSELMYGAHLAYNCQLHHMVFNSEHFDEDFQKWIDGIEVNMLDYSNFQSRYSIQLRHHYKVTNYFSL